MKEDPAKTTSQKRFRGLTAAERRAERRRRLIEAGLAAFGARGFHATGVRDICAQAGLTERYFYESFENREALFLAVYEHAVAHVRTALLETLESAEALPTPQLTRLLLRRYLELLRDEPPLVQVLLIDVTTIDRRVGTRSLAASREFSDLLLPRLEKDLPGLHRCGIDAQLVADGLLGATIFSVMQWAFDDFSTPLDDVLEHCALLFDAVGDELARRIRSVH